MGCNNNKFSDQVGTQLGTAVAFKTNNASRPGVVGINVTSAFLLVAIGPALPRNNLNDMYIAMYENNPANSNGPGRLLAPPLLIGDAPNGGTLCPNNGVFNWIQFDLTNNRFGTLKPNTYYWLALLPGLTFQVNLLTNQPTDTYEGVLLGGVVDQNGTILPQVAGDNLLFTSRELGSEAFVDDRAYGCNTTLSVTFYQDAENWSTIAGAGGRYRDSSQARPWIAVRHGIQVYGVEVGGGTP